MKTAQREKSSQELAQQEAIKNQREEDSYNHIQRVQASTKPESE